jgi:hypothetical protein
MDKRGTETSKNKKRRKNNSITEYVRAPTMDAVHSGVKSPAEFGQSCLLLHCHQFHVLHPGVERLMQPVVFVEI